MEPRAKPASQSTYVLPGSHTLDPPYSWELNRDWPNPRTPSAWESETRAPGTGFIGNPAPVPTNTAPTAEPAPVITWPQGLK